ncbi:hypothetical protein DBR17_02755 [Sphingomonas sp. HMWF008]|nr:hypothetical protein DBR17_02755 [Sphingomonas sp. HMWF008]
MMEDVNDLSDGSGDYADFSYFGENDQNETMQSTSDDGPDIIVTAPMTKGQIEEANQAASFEAEMEYWAIATTVGGAGFIDGMAVPAFLGSAGMTVPPVNDTIIETMKNNIFETIRQQGGLSNYTDNKMNAMVM